MIKILSMYVVVNIIIIYFSINKGEPRLQVQFETKTAYCLIFINLINLIG